MSDLFTLNHQSAAPPVPDADSLERVRAAAFAKTAKARWRPVSPPSLRFVATVAVAMLAVGAFVYALTPRVGDSAFARQRAADALLLPKDGSILHVETVFTSTGQTQQYGHDARYDLNQRSSSWVDPSHERERYETYNIGDGSLDELLVRSGDRQIVFSNNVRYGTGDSPQLVQTSAKGQPIVSPMGPMLDYVSAQIANGSAKVSGTTIVDGEPCWVVTVKASGSPELHEESRVTVVLRKSDYRIKTYDQLDKIVNGNGPGTSVTHLEFRVWETLSADSLAKDFFSLDAPLKAAPKGTKLEVRQ